MTTTTVVAKTGTTNEVLNVDTFNRANLALRKTTVTANGLMTEYVNSSGDSRVEVVAQVSANFDPKANNGYGASRYTCRLKSWVIETDDTSGEVLLEQPCEAGWFLTVPGKGMQDVTLFMTFLQNAFALAYPSVTAQEASEAALAELANFVTNIHG